MFEKGKSGNPRTQFSSTYQPKVCGRRPSILTKLDKQYMLSLDDQRKWYTYLNSLSVEDLEELASDKTLPVWQSELARLVFKSVAKGDLQVYRELHDRFYGKAVESVDVTTKGEKINDSLKIEVIDSREQVKKDEDNG